MPAAIGAHCLLQQGAQLQRCSHVPTRQQCSNVFIPQSQRPALTCVYGESLALLLGRDARLLAVLQLSVRLLVQGNEALDVAWSRESWRPLYSVSLKTHKQKSPEVQCIDVESFQSHVKTIKEDDELHFLWVQKVNNICLAVRVWWVLRDRAMCVGGWVVLKGRELLVLPEGSTEPSNWIHRQIKGYISLNQTRRTNLDVPLRGNGNWFLAKVFSTWMMNGFRDNRKPLHSLFETNSDLSSVSVSVNTAQTHRLWFAYIWRILN